MNEIASSRRRPDGEGFRDNRAYRQFRDLLRYFFYTGIVPDFFQSGGTQAEEFTRTRADLRRKSRARTERAERSEALRNEYAARLTTLAQDLEAGEPQAELGAIVESTRRALGRATSAADAQAAERAGLSDIAEVARRYSMDQPRGFGLDAELRSSIAHYEASVAVLQTAHAAPAARQISALAGDALSRLRATPSPGQRLRKLLEDSAQRARDDLAAQALAVKSALDDVDANAKRLIDGSGRTLEDVIDRTTASLPVERVNGDLAERLEAAERPILEVVAQEVDGLKALATQLRSISTSRDAFGVGISELEAIDAIEEELMTLRERGAAELELAQLGMGIQIVGHEFNASVGAVRGALRQIKPWADHNEGLRRPFEDLRAGFEHLEGYLRLLAPLQRRLNRRRSRIRGREIADYVDQLFGARLRDERRKDHDIKLVATPAFVAHEVVGYRSTFYPVFVALVDNALFWVREGDRPWWIRFDAKDTKMMVSNSGPPIRVQDRERIFELGFSRKPGGQGTGLFVVRESLRSQGFDITIDEDEDGRLAFQVAPQAEAPADDE